MAIQTQPFQMPGTLYIVKTRNTSLIFHASLYLDLVCFFFPDGHCVLPAHTELTVLNKNTVPAICSKSKSRSLFKLPLWPLHFFYTSKASKAPLIYFLVYEPTSQYLFCQQNAALVIVFSCSKCNEVSHKISAFSVRINVTVQKQTCSHNHVYQYILHCNNNYFYATI